MHVVVFDKLGVRPNMEKREKGPCHGRRGKWPMR